jgi:shikimate kinase
MKTRGPIIITGFMGCGKTEVARRLALRLNIEMADLDEAITKRERRSPARLIAEDGEKTFRAIETSALSDLLDRGAAGVIALGGGAWIENANRHLINQVEGKSVWLDTPFEVCWARIEASGEDRPLGRTRQQAQELYERRRPIYQLAMIRLTATADDGLDDLASRIETVVTNLA